jgi:hypothetical protein
MNRLKGAVAVVKRADFLSPPVPPALSLPGDHWTHLSAYAATHRMVETHLT